MRYILWAIVALVGYSFVPPLIQLSTEEMHFSVATFGATGILALTAGSVALISGQPVGNNLTGPHGKYVILAGFFLAVSILAFFYSLSLGRVSVVVPIFGLFLVFSSLFGVYFFKEPLVPRQLLGIGFAILSIILIATS